MRLLNQIKEIKYFFINLYGGICTIIDYIPILYKDRDWDESFLLRLMVKKLDRMQHYFLTHGIAADRKRVAKKILIIKTLLKRIEEDDYCQGDYELLTKKWGEYTWDIKSPCGSIISRENIKTKEDEKLYHKEFMRVVKKEEEIKKHDLHLALTLLERNLRTFWD